MSSWLLIVLLSALQLSQAAPGSRVLLDAHNCYPYGESWSDRIDRALSAGMPLAIEQDLAWHIDPRSGRAWSVLSHDAESTGSERTMKDYFFEHVRPIVEQALKADDRHNWPLITLNLDFKTEEPEHLETVWNLLNEYRDWITTAPRLADIHTMAPLDVRPLLVLTGESDAQKAVFYDQVRAGAPLLVFGATPARNEPADNYHRWWNNPWRAVEPEGQNAAGDWSPEDEKRLTDLVRLPTNADSGFASTRSMESLQPMKVPMDGFTITISVRSKRHDFDGVPLFGLVSTSSPSINTKTSRGNWSKINDSLTAA